MKVFFAKSGGHLGEEVGIYKVTEKAKNLELLKIKIRISKGNGKWLAWEIGEKPGEFFVTIVKKKYGHIRSSKFKIKKIKVHWWEVVCDLSFFDASINTRIVLNGFYTDFKCTFSYQE